MITAFIFSTILATEIIFSIVFIMAFFVESRKYSLLINAITGCLLSYAIIAVFFTTFYIFKTYTELFS